MVHQPLKRDAGTAPGYTRDGRSDLPIEHGGALAQAAAGAKFIKLDGGGHELHPSHCTDHYPIAGHIGAGVSCLTEHSDNKSVQFLCMHNKHA